MSLDKIDKFLDGKKTNIGVVVGCLFWLVLENGWITSLSPEMVTMIWASLASWTGVSFNQGMRKK